MGVWRHTQNRQDRWVIRTIEWLQAINIYDVIEGNIWLFSFSLQKDGGITVFLGQNEGGPQRKKQNPEKENTRI